MGFGGMKLFAGVLAVVVAAAAAPASADEPADPHPYPFTGDAREQARWLLKYERPGSKGEETPAPTEAEVSLKVAIMAENFYVFCDPDGTPVNAAYGITCDMRSPVDAILRAYHEMRELPEGSSPSALRPFATGIEGTFFILKSSLEDLGRRDAILKRYSRLRIGTPEYEDAKKYFPGLDDLIAHGYDHS